MQRLFYSTLNQVINEIDDQNTKLCAAVSAFEPDNSNFLDVKILQPVLDLVDRASVEAECDVVKTYVAKFNGNEKTKPTTIKVLFEHCEALMTMPSLHLALKLGVTLGASTAKCENSFSALKTIMQDRKQSMEHACKAHLVFESNLTKKLKTDWKANVFR